MPFNHGNRTAMAEVLTASAFCSCWHAALDINEIQAGFCSTGAKNRPAAGSQSPPNAQPAVVAGLPIAGR